jgi:hypothetical protein
MNNPSQNPLLNSLNAENLLTNSHILEQISALRKGFQYNSDGESISYDDYFFKLEKEVSNLKRIALNFNVPAGTETQYLIQLSDALGDINDEVYRVLSKSLHFQSKVETALNESKKLEASFIAWYTLAAMTMFQGSEIKLPAATIKALAESEFSRLMQGVNVELKTLIEALKIKIEQTKLHKKTQENKFNLGKEQINASWAGHIPNFGHATSEDERTEVPEPEELDEDVPAFVSKSPKIETPVDRTYCERQTVIGHDVVACANTTGHKGDCDFLRAIGTIPEEFTPAAIKVTVANTVPEVIATTVAAGTSLVAMASGSFISGTSGTSFFKTGDAQPAKVVLDKPKKEKIDIPVNVVSTPAEIKVEKKPEVVSSDSLELMLSNEEVEPEPPKPVRKKLQIIDDEDLV